MQEIFVHNQIDLALWFVPFVENSETKAARMVYVLHLLYTADFQQDMVKNQIEKVEMLKYLSYH